MLAKGLLVLRRWQKWLAPGLSLKRWLSLAIVGMVLVILGLAIWVDLAPVFRLQRFFSTLLRGLTDLIPSHISGPLVLLTGLALIGLGLRQVTSSLTDVLMPNGEDLVDQIKRRRRQQRGPRIVAIGGGTGLSTLLRGLKHYSDNITAIVTVADDGGSSGRLRRDMGVLPPGDIRNCLTALADEEALLTELFRYRFDAGDGLSGHSFGNLFISALAEITGKDLMQAIAATSKVLAIRGQVLPATLADVTLWVELQDGRWVEGESNIAKAKGTIQRIGCQPPQPPAIPEVIAAINAADYIILGPGSLYTSIIPNVLVPDIVKAIAANPAPHIYVCNIMTEPGETSNYAVGDHIAALDKVAGVRLFDGVLVQKYPPSERAIERYRDQGATPVAIDSDHLTHLGCRVVLAHVMHEDPETGLIRHDPERLSAMLMRWYERHRLH